MRWVWILAVLMAMTGCGREEQREAGGKVEPPPAEPHKPEPDDALLYLPGVERLVDLRAGKSPRDYQDAAAAFIRENRDLQVIAGAGWDREAFIGPPHKDQLDQVNDFIPIVLFSRDRSCLWVNSEALAAAGIDTGTPNPPGGTIEKDEGGLPNGLVCGTAMELVEKIIPRVESDKY